MQVGQLAIMLQRGAAGRGHLGPVPQTHEGLAAWTSSPAAYMAAPMAYAPPPPDAAPTLDGLSVVVTGTLEKYNRDEVDAFLVELKAADKAT